MSKLNKKSKLKATVATTVFVGAAATAAIVVPITASNKKNNDKQEGGLDVLAKNLSNWIAQDERMSGYVMENDPLYLNEQLKNLIESFIKDNKHYSFKFTKVKNIWFDESDFFHPVLRVTVSDLLSGEEKEIPIDSFSWNKTTFDRIFTSTQIGPNLEITGLTETAKLLLQSQPLDIYIPNQIVSKSSIFSVSSIAKLAFANLYGIKAFKLTNPKISKLVEIKDFAFQNMIDLLDFMLPSSIKKIGLNPWMGSSVYKISVDKGNKRYSVKTTNNSTYLFDNNNKSIVAVTDAMVNSNAFILNNNDVKSIDEYAFANLTSMNFLNLYNSNIVSLAPHSFEMNGVTKSSLSKVVIPNSLTKIGERAFYNVSSLMTFGLDNPADGVLYISDPINSVGSNAFSGDDATSAPKFTILSLLFKQRSDTTVWNGLTSLKALKPNLSIYIRDQDSAIQDGKLTKYEEFIKLFTYTEDRNGYVITGLNKNLTSAPSNIQIPNFIYNEINNTILPVYAIASNAFNFNAPNAFQQGLTNISSVKLGSQINQIGENAFANLPNLTNFTFESDKFNNLKYVPVGLFENCAKLDATQILSKWRNIEVVQSRAFKGTKTSNISLLGQTIKTIEDSAFENTNIANLDLQNASNLTTISTKAFANNQKLVSVTLPNTLVNLGAEAFKDNVKLTSINLENTSIQWIASNILQNTAIDSLKLPKTVTDVNQYGLANMPELRSLTLNEGLVTLNNFAISNDPKLLTLSMPITLANVGVSVLNGDVSLQEVWLSPEQFSNSVKASLEKGKEPITILKQLDNFDPNAGFNFNILNEPTNKNEVGEIELISYKGSNSEVVVPSFITNFGNNKKAKYKVVGIGEKAFSPFVSEQNKKIKSITLPETVTYINNNAFENLNNLKSINLDFITKLGSSVFMNNKSLVSTGTFNNGLIEIPSNTFIGCTSLDNVQLPSQLTTIGAFAFSNTGLTSIEIPNSVTTINESAFSNNNNLVTTTIGTGLTKIPEMMFYNSANFQNIIFNGSNIVSIGDSAFKNTSLYQIQLPRTLVSIGNQSFSNTQLSQVSLPDSVNQVGLNAFFPNSKLTKMMISIQQFGNPNVYNNVKFNSNDQFKCLIRTGLNNNSEIVTNDFTYEKIDNLTVKIKTYTGNAQQIVIPDVVQDRLTSETYKVVEIDDNVFQNKTNIKNVIFNRYVTKIGNNAFKNTSINHIEIPYPGIIKSLGIGAFSNTKLPNINFLEKTSVTELSDELFANTTTLVSVNIPKWITQWNARVFANTNIKELNLATNRNLNFNASAFESMSSLTKISLPTNLKTITQSMFKSCTSLQSIVLPVVLTTIEAEAFAGTKIVDLTLPTTVSSIDPNAFNGSNIKKVFYSVVNVLNQGFLNELNAAINKHNIVSHGYDDSVSPQQSSFGFVYQILNDNEVKITNYIGNDNNVFIPSLIKSYNDPNKIYRVTQLSDDMFQQKASNITKIAFDQGFNFTSLANGLLSNMPILQEVMLPRSLTHISKQLFANSTNLAKVNFQDLANLVEIQSEAFKNTGFKNLDLSQNTKLTEIQNDAFANSVQLISVAFPNSLTTLGTNAFSTTNILNLDLSQTKVTQIPSQAFMNSYSLQEVKLPANLTTIAQYAFRNSPNIAKVNYNNQTGYNFTNLPSLTIIGSQAFAGNSNLTKIDLSQTKIAKLEQFVDNNIVQYLKLPATLTSGLQISYFGVNIIEVDLSLCTTISKEMLRFYNMSKLTKVTLPINTIELPASVFEECKSLTTIENIDKVKRIEENSFRGCESLTSIPLSYAEITYIGTRAFAGTSIEKLDFITGRDANLLLAFDSVGAQFRNMKSLTQILIPPAGLTIIPPDFLKDCIRLSFINPLEFVQEIKNQAFMNCKSLNWYFIHRNITSIASNAFTGCNSLYSVVVHTYSTPNSYFDRIKSLINASFGGSSKIRYSVYSVSNKSPWFANNFNVIKTISKYSTIVIQEIQVTNIKLPKTWDNNECFLPPIFEYSENGIYYFNIITEIGNSDSTPIYNQNELTNYPQKMILPGGLKKLYKFAFKGGLLTKLTHPLYIPSSINNIGFQLDAIFLNNGLSSTENSNKVVFLGEPLLKINNLLIDTFTTTQTDLNLLALKKGTSMHPDLFHGKIRKLAIPFSIYEEFQQDNQVLNNLNKITKNNLKIVYFDDIRMFQDIAFRDAILDAFTDNPTDRNIVQFVYSNSPWEFNGW